MMLRSISWFGVVGACAAMVHYISAVILQANAWLSPANANWVAFLMAFPVSYIGHRKLSFAGTTRQHQQALPRFLLVALIGFAGNQSLLLLMLHFTALPFWLILAVVMLLIALMTFVLSKYWAFQHD